jgi:bifunctional UDP-N-acetylglucosamine pyrophosphorylase/glucosamine-1-phosphate N-acetyltransferase
MNLTCVILAAGLGKRMSSSLPKVIHPLCGKPMLSYPLDTISRLRPKSVIVVVGKHQGVIEKALPGVDVRFVVQQEPKGTGDALLTAVKAMTNRNNDILVLNGDMPLITISTLKIFLGLYRRNKDALSVLSFIAGNPASYGRILRDDSGKAVRIIEERDVTPQQRSVNEVNSGVYLMNKEATHLLNKLTLNRKKGEYYLTDLLEIAGKHNVKTGVYCIGQEEELMGVNTRQELMTAHAVMQQRILRGHMEKGVTFINASSAHIHHGVSIGPDTLIYPNVHLEGTTKIGTGCTIYPNVRIKNGSIGNRTTIKDSSLIEDSTVGHDAQIGPFAHVRPGSMIGPSAKIGNFVEIKKSIIGKGTKASHLSYLGDAVVGKNVNIGAGTITCNYDGKEKHKTEIMDEVFIGSDTQLVAPVRVGRGAFIGAGSTITHNVPSHSLALSRVRQKTIGRWALKRRSKTSSQQMVTDSNNQVHKKRNRKTEG